MRGFPARAKRGGAWFPAAPGCCSSPRPVPIRSNRCGPPRTFSQSWRYRHGLGLDRSSLETIRVAARGASHLEAALDARVRLLPGTRSGRRLSFRVVARLTGGDHEFRRIDFQRAVERGIGECGDRRLRLAGDDAEVEFWATMLADEFVLALRLSDERMRHREYKVAHRPASLRPAVAAAMGLLSEPRDDDIVLDPLCGAGTVLIERAQLARYRLLLGGDFDRGALEAARTNVGPRYKPIELVPWDAAAIPLRDASVTKIVTNLPWGLKSGSHAGNLRLYPALLAEFYRVLAPDGTMVLLTAETRLLRESLARPLQDRTGLQRDDPGAPAAVYVCRK